MHAKAYIFSQEKTNTKSVDEVIIAGSSNLTSAGLNSNLELNLGKYNEKTVSKGKKWFDNLWDEAVPFDLASFFEEIFQVKTPFEIFFKGIMGVIWSRN